MLHSVRLALLAFIGAAVCLAHGQVPAQKLSPKEIYTKCKDAVVKIETDKGTGTGFFYMEDNLIATCFHVIGDASKIEVKDTAGHSWTVESVYFDKRSDAALLRVKGVDVKPLPSADPTLVSVGEDLAVIGSPLGVLEETLTTGVLSAKREVEHVQVFQTTAPVSPGSSGSPLLTSGGTVLGFVSFTFTEGQALNIAVGCAELVKLAKKDSVPVSLFLVPVSNKSAGKPEDHARERSIEEQSTDLYLSVVNQISSARQNWEIQYLQVLNSPHISRLDAGNLQRAVTNFQEALQCPERSKFESFLDDKKLWQNSDARNQWLKALESLGELTSQLYDAQIDLISATIADDNRQIKRAKSIKDDIHGKVSALTSLLAKWGSSEDWFLSQRSEKYLNIAALMPLVNFQRTYFVADPHFPDRAQIGFVKGNPFHIADVIIGFKLRNSPTITEIHTWSDFLNFYNGWPAEQCDLVFKIVREGKSIELGAILSKGARNN